MAECDKCGISEESTELFNAISNKGVIKICKKCLEEWKFPLIQSVVPVETEKIESVYDRLSRMAHLDPQKHKENLLEKAREDSKKEKIAEREKMQNVILSKSIEENIREKNIHPRRDLIDNFHWVLMRSRRSKKLTRKQLAEKIGESEEAIKRAEEGMVLNNADIMLRKLENYFGIRIKKNESPYALETSEENPYRKEVRASFEKEVNFNHATTESLTISDLKEIKRKKELERLGNLPLERKEEKTELKMDKELSDEEVRDILFRR